SPIPIVVKIDVTNLVEIIPNEYWTQRSIDDYEARQNFEKVKEHMVDEKIENFVEGTENENVDEFLDDILNDKKISALDSAQE
nr:hypothetical protein [Tanacetum cinerariifolium]